MWRASCLARRACAAATTRASRALRPRPTPQSARALAGARRAEHRRTAWTSTSTCVGGRGGRVAMSTRARGSEASSAAPPEEAASWTGGSLDSLAAWLRAHGVDPAAFASAANDAKSLSELAREVARGETTLVARDTFAERRVRVLRLLIRDALGRVLIEARQEWSDGRVRERGTPLSEKMLRDEDWRDAAKRAVAEELGSCLVSLTNGDDHHHHHDEALRTSAPNTDFSGLVSLDESSVKFSSIDRVSVSYPGLSCAYEFVTVDAEVRGLPKCNGTFVASKMNDDDANSRLDAIGEPSFTSTERNADGTTLVATWVWREGYVVDDD